MTVTVPQLRMTAVLGLWLAAASIHAVELELADEYEWADLGLAIGPKQASMGSAIATDGNWAIVGAPGEDDLTGRLYLFKVGSNRPWEYVKPLELPPAPGACRYGERFDLADGWLAVAADNCRSVLLYQRDFGGSGNWGLVQEIAEPADLPDRRVASFAVDVALSSDLLAVGADTTDLLNGGSVEYDNAGEVHIYRRDQGGVNNWGSIARLILPAGQRIDGARFGQRVALDSGRLVVGAPSYPINGLNNVGRAWVFERNLGGSDNWGLRATLNTSQSAIAGWFGSDVDLAGSSIAVGAALGAGDLTVPDNDGAVFMFQQDSSGSNNWDQVDAVFGDPTTGDFGGSVDLEGDLLLVGSGFNSFTARGIWLYQRNSANLWPLIQPIVEPTDPNTVDFGVSIDLARSGTRIVAAVGDSKYFLPNSGFVAGAFGKTYFYEYEDGLFSDGFE